MSETLSVEEAWRDVILTLANYIEPGENTEDRGYGECRDAARAYGLAVLDEALSVCDEDDTRIEPWRRALRDRIDALGWGEEE